MDKTSEAESSILQAALNESSVQWKLIESLTEYFGNGDLSSVSDDEEDETSGDELDDKEPKKVDNMTDSECEDSIDGGAGGDKIERPIC